MPDPSRYSETMPADQSKIAPRRAPWRRIAGVFSALALGIAAVWAPAASAAPANYRAASGDGKVVFFTTSEQLVPGDTDSRQDVYERSYDEAVGDYVTREVSTGPIGGNDAYDALFERISDDGSKAFFSTSERLDSADTDSKRDGYVRDLQLGTTSLVTRGDSSCSPACGNGAADADVAGATGDGEAAFFVTSESLSPTDTDSTFDVYERRLASGTTTLVSVGAPSCSPACGNGAFAASFWALSSDGSTAFFASDERLAGGDTDSADDIYARDLAANVTYLVSAGDSTCSPACGNSGAVPVFRGSSSSGSRVYFTSDEVLAAGDGDTATDVYARDLPSGPTTLISAGTDANLTASFAAASSDGSDVFFTTTEKLVSGDTNGATDVYEWAGAEPGLVTSGTCTQVTGCGSTFNSSTADGGTILFTTTERLDSGDTDDSADIYEAQAPAWAPTLVSAGAAECTPGCGNGPVPAILNASSADASQVFFSSTEQLSSLDSDSGSDIYRRDLVGDTTSLASPSGVCPHVEACNIVFRGASADSAHLFFQTDERLTAEDVDSELDVYERSAGVTRIVSVGNSAQIGPATPVLTATDPTSPGESTTPRIRGQADLETSVKIYSSGDCSGIPVATGTSLELGGAGVSVAVATGSTASFRATSTDTDGDTSACSPALSYTQQTPELPPPPPPPPPGEEGKSSGTGSGGKSGGTGGGEKGHGNGGVTYVAPQTLITFGPSSKTKKRRPVFRFTDATEQLGTSFFCRVDRHRWTPCNSPRKLSRLAPGGHLFRVKARNAVGVWGSQPVQRKFKVVG
jgi:hypothetical protein